jgi:ADP-ribose pyrophosphatase YjhB (NUDIX family)
MKRIVILAGDITENDPAAVIRIAAKCLARHRNRVLLLYSEAARLYKIPGGGVHAGETVEATLARELDEETGLDLLEVQQGALVEVIERRPSIEDPKSIFEMQSTYLGCTVSGSGRPQRLESYEEALGFTVRWVDPTVAVAQNKVTLGERTALQWLDRDTRVLDSLTQDLALIPESLAEFR